MQKLTRQQAHNQCLTFTYHDLDAVHAPRIGQLKRIESRIPKIPTMTEKVYQLIIFRIIDPKKETVLPKNLNVVRFGAMMPTRDYLALVKCVNCVINAVWSANTYEVAKCQNEFDNILKDMKALGTKKHSLQHVWNLGWKMFADIPSPVTRLTGGNAVELMSDACNLIYCSESVYSLIHYIISPQDVPTMKLLYFAFDFQHLLEDIKKNHELHDHYNAIVKIEFNQLRKHYPVIYNHYRFDITKRIHQYRQDYP